MIYRVNLATKNKIYMKYLYEVREQAMTLLIQPMGSLSPKYIEIRAINYKPMFFSLQNER